ncbi:MAG: hypothetical protein C7N36_03025 [Bacteroidetes bacterium]|nr:MAG: hypothetical protein C7N36_03025 [Bacteroidota bacterium]
MKFAISSFVLILFFLSPLFIQAQPASDLDLGGEDPLVSAVADSTTSQIMASFVWWKAALNVDSLKLAGNYVYALKKCNVFWSNEVVANPGQMTPYDQLNVFAYLADLGAFQNYLMFRMYQLSPDNSDVPSPPASTPSPSTDTPRTTMQRPDLPPTKVPATSAPRMNVPPKTVPATTTTPQIRNAPAAAQPPIADRKAAVFARETFGSGYPLVRKFLVLENGLAANPQFQELTPNAFPLDMTYAEKVENYRQLTSLYQAALADPAADECSPAVTPEFYFVEDQKALSGFLKNKHLDVLTTIKEEMDRQVASRPVAYRTSPERQAQMVIPALEQTPIPLATQRYLALLARELTPLVVPLRRQYDALQAQYAICQSLLQPEEAPFFEWVMTKSERIIVPIEAVRTYALQVASLPNQETNYTQLVLLGELLRISRERVDNIYGAEDTAGKALLAKVTQHYHQAVVTHMRLFGQLGAAYRRN